MKRQNMRVVLASEHPQARHFLREAVEEEDGAVIVGQADNATKALTLTKHLRPDVAIIDCWLPHAVGLDTVPLSRVGGLDTAQTISEEMPNMKVILLNNVDTSVLPEDGLNPDGTVVLAVKRMGVDTPFVLQDLCYEAVPSNDLVFANVAVKPRVSLRQKITSPSGKNVVFGSLGILGGLSLMPILVLSGAWFIPALVGAVAIGVGVGLLWKRIKL